MTPEPDTDELNRKFLTACELHTSGDYIGARDLYSELLRLVDAPLLRYNLSLVYIELNDQESARDHLERALAMQPDDEDTLFNLAIVHKQLGKISHAIDTYRRLIDINNSHIDAYYNLGGCYRENGETALAIGCYEKAILLKPQHSSAINNIAFCYHLQGEEDKALHYYQKLLELKPDHVAARHMAAALEGRTTEHPPEEYIRDIFDNYSENYEESLVNKLEYSVPDQLFGMLGTLSGDDVPTRFNRGVDLGCGTGLSGAPFGSSIGSFHGIDLSQKMIDIAAQKGIYSKLTAGNIRETINSEPPDLKFDFILAADVLTYIGELDGLFKDISRKSSDGALFCFSTETGEGDSYSLRPSGRYAHTTGYISKLLESYGWATIACQHTKLRKERGEWITGHLWIAKL